MTLRKRTAMSGVLSPAQSVEVADGTNIAETVTAMRKS